MISTALIGAISLNLSFILYLLVYLPQILHNRASQNLANLSIGMHVILLSSYCLDLIYGFSNHLQWQYITVSVVSLTLLIIQHGQLSLYFLSQKKWQPLNFNLFFIVFACAAVTYFFTIKQATLTVQTTQTIGYLSRAGFLIFTLPQIIKNKTLSSANAICNQYIHLSMILCLLDMTSAWCLDWGWPNKLGSPLTMSLLLMIRHQQKKYRSMHPIRTLDAHPRLQVKQI